MTVPAIVLAATEIAGHRETTISDTSRLQDLITITGLTVATGAQQDAAKFVLYWRDSKLTLRDQSTKNHVDISIDFCSGKNKHRLLSGSGYGQPLARAIDAKPDATQLICDATGGLGQDSFVFASLGCRVAVFERSKIIFALLQDALKRAANDQLIGEITERMTIHQLDSRSLPQSWPFTTLPATVYLDPMYPHSAKSAASKKGMQTLQRLLPLELSTLRPTMQQQNNNHTSAQTDEQTLLQSALVTATQRVTVKRPAKAPPIEGPTPVGSIKSPNTRYDLYNARDFHQP